MANAPVATNEQADATRIQAAGDRAMVMAAANLQELELARMALGENPPRYSGRGTVADLGALEVYIRAIVRDEAKLA